MNPINNNATPMGVGRGAESKANYSATNLTPFVQYALASITEKLSGNASATQRDRLRAALPITALSTLDCRERLDIMHPAMRVKELRNEGLDIQTVWVVQDNAQGNCHRVGKYVLRSGSTATQPKGEK